MGAGHDHAPRRRRRKRILIAIAAIALLAVLLVLFSPVRLHLRWGEMTPEMAMAEGRKLFARGNHAAAEEYFRYAVTSLAGQPDRLDEFVLSLQLLAQAYDAQGNAAQAQVCLERSVKRVKEVRGSDAQEVGIVLGELGWFHLKHRNFDEAQGCFQNARRIFAKHLGTQHPYVGGALCHLGIAAQRSGETGKAERLYKEALAIFEPAIREEWGDFATTSDNLARLYIDAGRFQKAREVLRSAISRIETLGLPEAEASAELQGLRCLLMQAEEGGGLKTRE
jgi:tetratricopeptide (TPR) repeat protein